MDTIKKKIYDLKWNYLHSLNFDVSNFELDISRLKSIVPDFQFTSLEEGLEKTIKWQKEINI